MNRHIIIRKICSLLFHSRGQSMVEFAVAAPFLLFMAFAIFYTADFYIIKEKTLVSARYGTWRLAHYDKLGDVKSAIKDIFFPDTDKYRVKIREGAGGITDDIESVNTGNRVGLAEDLKNTVDGAFDFLQMVMTGGRTSSRKQLSVTYQVPFKIGPFDTGDSGLKQLQISSSYVMTYNCWDGSHTGVHEPVEAIWNTVVGGVASIFGTTVPGDDIPEDFEDDIPEDFEYDDTQKQSLINEIQKNQGDAEVDDISGLPKPK